MVLDLGFYGFYCWRHKNPKNLILDSDSLGFYCFVLFFNSMVGKYTGNPAVLFYYIKALPFLHLAPLLALHHHLLLHHYR